MSARSWDEIVAVSRTVPPAAASSIAAAATAARVADAGAGANAVAPPEEGSVEAGTRRSSPLTSAGGARAPRWMGLRFSPPRPSPASRLESPLFSARPEVDTATVASVTAVPVITLPSVDVVAAVPRIVDEPNVGIGSTRGGASERASERSFSGRSSERSWGHGSEHYSEHASGRSSERASEERGLVETTATNGAVRCFAKTPPSGRGLASWRSYRASVEAAAAVTQHTVAAAGAAAEEEEERGGYGSRFGQDSVV